MGTCFKINHVKNKFLITFPLTKQNYKVFQNQSKIKNIFIVYRNNEIDIFWGYRCSINGKSNYQLKRNNLVGQVTWWC